MNLQHPWALLLLLLVPLAVFARTWRRRTLSLPFGDGRTLARLPRSWAVSARWLLPALFAAGLALLAIASARPRRVIEGSAAAETRDIVLLVDVSTSMRAVDLSVTAKSLSRLDAARDVIKSFIAKRPDDRIGMVVFGALPYTVAPLTLDHAWLARQVDRLQPGMIEDGTAIGEGIASALNRLRESGARSKVVILLTDGINNRGLSPENAAEAARALGIRIHAVGAGATGAARIPVEGAGGGTRFVLQESGIDEAALRGIAGSTGGRYFRAGDFAALEGVYAEIDRMERTRLEIGGQVRYEERFALFAVLGILFLALEKALALTRLGRLP